MILSFCSFHVTVGGASTSKNRGDRLRCPLLFFPS